MKNQDRFSFFDFAVFYAVCFAVYPFLVIVAKLAYSDDWGSLNDNPELEDKDVITAGWIAAPLGCLGCLFVIIVSIVGRVLRFCFQHLREIVDNFFG